MAETAAHVAHTYGGMLGLLKGTFALGLDEIDAHNDRVPAEDPERDPDVPADRVEAGARGTWTSPNRSRRRSR